MSYRLPEYINTVQLADKRGELKGQIPVSRLDRLGDMLVDDTGSVTVELYFSREGRVPIIQGEIVTELSLCCQNCLQAVIWPVKHTVNLGIVKSIEQANRLPENIDPLLLEQDTVPIKDIIEDELLLSLPTYPKHQYDCLALYKDIKNTDANKATKEQEAKINPFSILANLKNTGEP